MRKCHTFCANKDQLEPYETQKDNNGSERLHERMCSTVICTIPRYIWYHMDKVARTVLYKYRNCYYLLIELSGWKGSVTYGLGADISLPHCLATGIWTLAHPKSDLRAEISGSIVWYEALAPRPEVLLLWYFVGACAATLELKFFPYSWENINLSRVLST